VKVKGKSHRTIWLDSADNTVVCAIDQRLLPHKLSVARLSSCKEIYLAIKDMMVRGAPLIGVAAAYGVYLAALEAAKQSASYAEFKESLSEACRFLGGARPTAVNLSWALAVQQQAIAAATSVSEAIEILRKNADQLTEAEVKIGRLIGEHGLPLLQRLPQSPANRPIQILTHCNAGWLACVDWGTATAPIYNAFDAGIDLHVWVDETRPRNQGAALTSWELGEHGVPHTLIVDNAGGHLMQNGMVDVVIVGTDRLTRNGDAANKIGTYLKALAAHASGVPFYVAAPSTSIDWSLDSGAKIPIEERDQEEVRYVHGLNDDGQAQRVLICPETTRAANWGFDVTPAHLISGIITERGVCRATEEGLLSLFPEQRAVHVR
jgi:methylthioribose-1-phosphate isomerase